MKAQIVAVVCYQHPLFEQSKLQLLFVWSAQQTLLYSSRNVNPSAS